MSKLVPLSKQEVEELYKFHQEHLAEDYTLVYDNSSGIGATVEVSVTGENFSKKYYRLCKMVIKENNNGQEETSITSYDN